MAQLHHQQTHSPVLGEEEQEEEEKQQEQVVPGRTNPTHLRHKVILGMKFKFEPWFSFNGKFVILTDDHDPQNFGPYRSSQICIFHFRNG